MRTADVERWDPTSLTDLARSTARREQALAAAAEELRRLIAGLRGWCGSAADAGRHALSVTADELDTHRSATARAAIAAARAAEQVTALKSGDITAPGALDVAERIDARLAGELIFTADGVHFRESPGRPVFPGPQSSTEQIGDWWRDLSHSEREALLAGRPDLIGDLDGIPVAARDRANRELLRRDLTDGAGTTLINAEQVRDGLAVNRERTGAPTYLVTYQPDRFSGQGRAAIAIGNPDAAMHTAVLVPGTGASVASGWLADDTDHSDLFNELACAAGDSATVAVVAWMGYNAPDSLIDPRVALPRLARDGGAILAADVGALRATAKPNTHITVIGHSYGATTVADAAAGSAMRADDIVLTGSPGSDLAHTVADFHLPADGHVYVGAASTDPVTFLAGTRGELPATDIPTGLAGLGPDPAADGFGSTRFRAEAPGLSAAIWADHGSYFSPGSESLYSIADIAGGDGRLLESRGMTAPHRSSVLSRIASVLELPNWSSPPADPELIRPATGGHFHNGVRG